MEINVVAHEGGDEVVGVVVEGLHPQLHVVVVLGGCQKEVLWLQLGLQEAVSCALVDQDGHLREEISLIRITWSPTHLRPGVGGNQLCCIISLSCFHRAQVTSEGLKRGNQCRKS